MYGKTFFRCRLVREAAHKAEPFWVICGQTYGGTKEDCAIVLRFGQSFLTVKGVFWSRFLDKNAFHLF
jgi:hypothetical protein